MLLIPYNTDAPLYHPPFATVATILVNVLLFVPVLLHEDPYAEFADYRVEPINWEEIDFDQFAVDENGQPLSEQEKHELRREVEASVEEAQAAAEAAKDAPRPIWRHLTLEFGRFRPWQWLTANYMHDGLVHLLGNMFVLWGFGLVVEGKVGWWRFLAIYNLIGIAGCGLVQLLMLFADEGLALGASLAIFGVLVIALVWAPSNNMQCVFMFGLRPIAFEASIMTIAMGALFLQFVISGIHVMTSDSFALSLRITSEVLHLVGAGFGFAIGVVMVKRQWVDCENWDMFSVWAGKHIRTSEEEREDVSTELERIKQREKRKLSAAESPPFAMHPSTLAPQTHSIQPLEQFRAHVAAGRTDEAWTTFCRGEQQTLGWSVPEPDFVQYISQLRKQQKWENAASAMQEYLLRYSERETIIRLALAQILIQQLDRYREAWSVLSEVNGALISDKEKASYDKLRAACRARAAVK